jgi:hypothetical protein
MLRATRATMPTAMIQRGRWDKLGARAPLSKSTSNTRRAVIVPITISSHVLLDICRIVFPALWRDGHTNTNTFCAYQTCQETSEKKPLLTDEASDQHTTPTFHHHLRATDGSATTHASVPCASIAVWAWTPLPSREASTNRLFPLWPYFRAFYRRKQGSFVPNMLSLVQGILYTRVKPHLARFLGKTIN